MANRINLNQTSFHGAGAINEIAAEVKIRGLKKALVCSDPDLIKFNVTTKVTKVLEDAGLEYELYSDIKPNPTIQNVQHGVEAFKKAGADYIIAIGGGSSMDTSKAIGIIIANPEFEDVRSLEGTAPTKNPCVPIIAVPTTAGTAAEVTINYVITDVEKKRKFVCVDPHCIIMCLQNLFYLPVRPFISTESLELAFQYHSSHTDCMKECIIMISFCIPCRIKTSDQRSQFILLTGIIILIERLDKGFIKFFCQFFSKNLRS